MKRLSKVRIAAGLSQRQLADLSGVNLNSIQLWESVKGRPIDTALLSTILKIAVALQCPLQDILENEENIEMLNRINK